MLRAIDTIKNRRTGVTINDLLDVLKPIPLGTLWWRIYHLSKESVHNRLIRITGRSGKMADRIQGSKILLFLTPEGERVLEETAGIDLAAFKSHGNSTTFLRKPGEAPVRRWKRPRDPNEETL